MYALELRNLQKIYTGGVTAVKNVTLMVESGDFFALLGPNGAGKSTIIGIVSSLINQTAGQVKIFGYDTATDVLAAKACIGIVPQELNFNQFEKLIDIVINQAGFYGIGRKLAFTRAEKYLSQLGLWDKRNEISRTLSGGMKRRLMIARALMHEPKMLILDEPTAGVDIELRRATWHFLEELNRQGTTIILTTHYLEEAEYLCRNLAIIDKGTIVEQANMKDLLRTFGTETFVLELKTPLLLANLPQLENCSLKFIDATTLEIQFSKTLSLNQLFAELSAHDLNVLSIRSKNNRLEELFLRLIAENNEIKPEGHYAS